MHFVSCIDIMSFTYKKKQYAKYAKLFFLSYVHNYIPI